MILSDRDVYTAAHLTAEVKEALRVFAREQRKSMSAVIFEAVQEKLQKEGVKIEKEENKEQDVRLPYDTH